MSRTKSRWDYKTKKHERIGLTKEENETRDKEESEGLKNKAKEDWLLALRDSDGEMTREREEHIDHLIELHGQEVELHPELKAKWQKKKDLRAKKPLMTKD